MRSSSLVSQWKTKQKHRSMQVNKLFGYKEMWTADPKKSATPKLKTKEWGGILETFQQRNQKESL